MNKQEEIEIAKNWWYDLSDQKIDDLIMNNKLKKPIKDADIVKLFSLHIVSNCAVWKPKMLLRWYETENYNPVNNDFDKILQQKWQSNTGQEKWEEIEAHGR